MQIPEVDPVGAEPTKAALDCFDGVLGTPGHSDEVVILLETELCGNNNLVSVAFQSATDEFLIRARTIDLSGIPEGDTEINCELQC